MRFLFPLVGMGACIFLAGLPAAKAQEGAPLPLVMANADNLPPHYVPLPPGMEPEPLANFLENAPQAPLPPPVPVAEAAPAPTTPPWDALALCRDKVGYDSDRALSHCLAESYEKSLQDLEQAAKAAHERTARQGQPAIRALASSNMAFTVFRDSECTRQKNLAAGAPAQERAEWACHAGLNNLRAQMLGITP